jgi:tetratricopeptide (TPR) repeat protein
VPEKKDIESIERVLERIGEDELDIGEIGGDEYVAREEPLSVEEGGAGEALADLDELLKDIEIGLGEEKELEERLVKEEAEEELPSELETAEGEEKEGVPEIPEAGAEEEELILPPEVPFPEPEAPREGEPTRESAPEAEAVSEPEEGIDLEEALSLPADFDLGDIEFEEEPPGAVFKPPEEKKKGKETPSEEIVEGEELGEEEAEAPPIEIEEEAIGEIGEELMPPEQPPVELPPSEFEEEPVTVEEEVPVEIERAPEEELGLGEEVAAGEPSEPEETAGLEEILSLPEDFDFGDLSLEEAPPEEAIPAPEEEQPPEGAEEREGVEMPDLEALESLVGAEEEPFVPEEEEIEEPPVAEELEITEEEQPPEGAIPEFEEEIPSKLEPVRVSEIEISDEDVVLITTKLKQLDPTLALIIRDIIVGETLPLESLKELIDLLRSDVPQTELVVWVEGATGERVVPKARIPEVIGVPRRPTAITRIVENLGPVVRVAGLFVVILAIVTVLFMIFVYRPMRAGRYYQEAIELLRNERYEEAEVSFSRAVRIYEKVGEYDNFGWEYMRSGNYGEALNKLSEGIAKDRAVKNISIRLHLAQLHNILGNYEEADLLYDSVIKRKPRVYEYRKLKGENLIIWGKLEDERLDTAYKLFREEYVQDQKNSDPLFHMLSIHLMRRDDENIDYIYNLLNTRYPHDVNKEVYTQLAGYYLDNGKIDPVRGIIAPVIKSYPDYPDAYYTFANYYKDIKNKSLQEELLKKTIEYENERELIYPWETRNRELISDAYNDLGEIYAGMEIAGMSAESIKYFKQAIEENEQNIKAYFNLAQVYFYGEKNYDLARSFYESAKRMGYANNDLNYNLGVLYYYQKRFRSALRQLSELSYTMPENPNIIYATGSALLHLGEYSSALGEFLILEERYDDLVNSLGEIKPWRAYHKRIVLEAARVNNNLGVAYQKLYEAMGDPSYQKKALVALYKGGELADIMGMERGEIQYNINYIIHPEVIRSDMAVTDNISHNYRFLTQ